MSRSKATKRRKVWVDEWDDISTTKQRGYAPFVQRLPGDVVLSREDVKWLLSKALVTDFESADDRSRTLAILRGRR